MMYSSFRAVPAGSLRNGEVKLVAAVLFEAFGTVNGTDTAGTEGNLGRFAAFGAHGLVHLPALSGGLFAFAAAVGTAARVAAETFGSVKLLFSGGKNKILAAIGAC